LGFRDDLDAIVAGLPAERRSHLVSATFPASVKQLASRFQSNALQLEGTSLGQANQDIEHIAHLIHEDDRYKAIVNVLLSHLGERALVFVRKRTDAAEVAEELANEGFAALPLSGDMAQAQRQRALAAFKSGTVHVLIATDVAARGIHVDDIAVVIHSDIPTDSETYTHRSGRTGRAGNKGCSVLLVPARGERRAQRLFQDARVNATFAPLPNPKKIRQRLVKDARRRLHERLLGGAELTQLEYATQLLTTNSPEKLVATLLEMAETPLPREPFEINTPAPRQARPQSAGGPSGPGSGEYARALITWGIKHGANVNRVLSHICRRSGFSREAFGAIDVGPTTSTVDIRVEAAAEFFQKVRTPDERDPAVRITPLAAGQHVSARPQGGGPGRPMRAQGRGFSDAGAAASNSGPARRKHTIKTGKFADRRGPNQD
jgi:ATP-dependent RNA helicase DeaD